MSEGKITATLKAGTGFDMPWIVVGADSAAELRDMLGAIEQSGVMADVGRLAASFRNFNALGGTLGARPVDAPTQPQAPAQAPQPPTPQTNGGFGAPAPQAQPQAPQAPATGGVRQVADNFGNTWEYDVPNAPMTPRGPAIVKVGNGPKGEWRKWYDPAAGPEWFTQRQPKVAAGDRWQGGFVN